VAPSDGFCKHLTSLPVFRVRAEQSEAGAAGLSSPAHLDDAAWHGACVLEQAATARGLHPTNRKLEARTEPIDPTCLPLLADPSVSFPPTAPPASTASTPLPLTRSADNGHRPPQPGSTSARTHRRPGHRRHDKMKQERESGAGEPPRPCGESFVARLTRGMSFFFAGRQLSSVAPAKMTRAGGRPQQQKKRKMPDVVPAWQERQPALSDPAPLDSTCAASAEPVAPRPWNREDPANSGRADSAAEFTGPSNRLLDAIAWGRGPETHLSPSRQDPVPVETCRSRRCSSEAAVRLPRMALRAQKVWLSWLPAERANSEQSNRLNDYASDAGTPAATPSAECEVPHGRRWRQSRRRSGSLDQSSPELCRRRFRSSPRRPWVNLCLPI